MNIPAHMRTLAIALVTAAVLAQPASAGFEIPAVDLTSGPSGIYPHVATDGSGTAHFVWYRGGAVETRSRGGDGTLSQIRTVATGGTDQRTASDAAGNVHFVWRAPGAAGWVARTRRLGADGVMGPVRELSSDGFTAVKPQLALDASGGVTFAWSRTLAAGTIIQARRLSADGTLGPVENISAAGSVGEPELAVDATGTAVIGWISDAGAEVRRWAADGTLGPIKKISESTPFTHDLRIAIDAYGNAHLAFEWGDAVIHRVMDSGGLLGPAKDLRLLSSDAAREPSLAVDSAGNARVMWYSISGSTYPLQARQRNADGTYGPVETLAADASTVTRGTAIAYDAGGNAHHVWIQNVPSPTGTPRPAVMARTLTAGGTLGAVEQLSPSSFTADGGADHLAMGTGPARRPVATWSYTPDGSSRWVQASAPVLPPPAGSAVGDSGSGGTAGGSAGGIAGGAGPDRLAPALSGLALRPSRLAVRRSGRVEYRLSEAARVVLRVARIGGGRLVGGRCVKPATANRSAKRCDLLVKGSLRVDGRAGSNRFRFRGRLGGRYLGRGRYVLVASATDPAGNSSAPGRARFRVVRRVS